MQTKAKQSEATQKRGIERRPVDVALGRQVALHDGAGNVVRPRGPAAHGSQAGRVAQDGGPVVVQEALQKLQQEAICFKELAWTYQQQRCEIDKDCFQHGLDSDRKHASITHHQAVRESMDPTTRLWSDALVCLLWSGLVCLWLALVLSSACGAIWFDALV